jgi:hypothetical protein
MAHFWRFVSKIETFLGKLHFAIIWTFIILILLALPGSLIPREDVFAIPGFDKVVHVVLFGGFVWLWCLYYKSKKLPQSRLLRSFFYIFILAAAYGIGMEYVQKYFIPGRDYDQGDIIADLIGAGLAYGLCNTRLIF